MKQTQTVIIRQPKFMLRVPIGKTAIAEKQNPESPYYDPTFPRKIRIGLRAVGYVEAEVEAWLQAQIEKSRAAA